MSLPESNPNMFRCFIRSSADFGTPNNFIVPFPVELPVDIETLWFKVQSVSLAPNPNPKDTYTAYAFDTGCGIDICTDTLQVLNETDNFTGTLENYTVSSPVPSASGQTSITVPIANKTGICFSGAGYANEASPYVGDLATIPGVVITGTATPATLQVTGFTSTGVTFGFYPNVGKTTATWSVLQVGTVVSVTHAQEPKSIRDRTLAFLPYSQVLSPQPWLQVELSGETSKLGLKLFNDKGYPLKLRCVDQLNDINIDDWVIELLIYYTEGKVPPASPPPE